MTSASKSFTEITRLTGGFIGSEPLFFLLMIVISSATGVISSINPEFLLSYSNYQMILERGIQLWILYAITKRWKLKLAIQNVNSTIRTEILFVFFGFALWGSIMGPIVGLTIIKSGSFILLFLLGVGSYYSLIYYFYHIPLIFGSLSLRHSLQVAKELIEQDRFLPFKIIGSASGITILLFAILSAPYPDGRSVLFNSLALVASGLFWVLSCYLSLAAACLLLSDKYWHEWKLDPYRSSRFETLGKYGSSIINEILTPKGATIAILLGCMCMAANFFRSQDMPPPSTIIVESATVKDDIVTVKLNLSDEVYSFRGTSPMNFALAGESRAVISAVPESVSDSVSGEDKMFLIPKDQKQERITLTFKADRPAEALVALKDLYLWYKNVKISHLQLSRSDTQS